MYELENRRFFKGEVYWVNFPEAMGSVQGGMHPAIITSNNLFNKHAPVVQVSSITSKCKESPVHVPVGEEVGLEKQSWILIEQDTTIPKELIGYRIGKCNNETLLKVEEALLFQKGIDTNRFIKEEPFNIDIANRYVERILRLNKMIKRLKENKLLTSDDLLERESLINEFKEYCLKYNVNPNIFFNEYKEEIKNNIRQQREQLSVAK